MELNVFGQLSQIWVIISLLECSVKKYLLFDPQLRLGDSEYWLGKAWKSVGFKT